MRIEVMEWKTDIKGKTYRHKVTATVLEDVVETKQVALDYAIICFDTGKHTEFAELRSVIDDVLDLRPSFAAMAQARETLM